MTLYDSYLVRIASATKRNLKKSKRVPLYCRIAPVVNSKLRINGPALGPLYTGFAPHRLSRQWEWEFQNLSSLERPMHQETVYFTEEQAAERAGAKKATEAWWRIVCEPLSTT